MIEFRYLIKIFIFLFVSASTSYAADIYMGAEETYTDLQSAMSAMSAGDTLIIRAGTYTGSANTITSTAYPPTSTDTWTTIQAETPGTVFFGDPDTTVSHGMFYCSPASETNAHWIFDGITWYSGVGCYGIDYVKFFRCGGGSNYNTVGNFSMWQFSACEYILCEDCWMWGGARYSFATYQAQNNVFRRCVSRIDAVDTSHDSTTEPIGGYSIYYSSNTEVQNCIMIDSDYDEYWVWQSFVGAFTCPNGSGSNVAFRGCIALNLDMPPAGSASGYTGITRENNVYWGVNRATIWGGVTTADHMTIGGIPDTDDANLGGINGYGSTVSATNSLFYQILGDLGAVYNVTSDYNYYYGNQLNFNGGSSAGTNDVTTTDPALSLLYLVRIEDSTALDGQASDSGDIGATVLKKIGTSGTLYGETGYATLTSDDLWPWPNEDIIKTQFQAYEYDDGSGGDPELSGDRGFASSTDLQDDGVTNVTLTSYIWEYLGNQMPSDIYGEDTTPPTLDAINVQASGLTTQFDFSENMAVGSDGYTNFDTLVLSGGSVTLSGCSITNDIVECNNDSQIPYGATFVSFAYTQPGDGLQDTATTPNNLASIVTYAGSFTNNVPEPGSSTVQAVSNTGTIQAVSSTGTVRTIIN